MDPLALESINQCNWAPFSPSYDFPVRRKGAKTTPCTNFTIAYSPSGSATVTDVMTNAFNLLNTEPFSIFLRNFTIQGFPDNTTALNYIMLDSPYDVGCQALVDFVDVNGADFDIQIRFAYTPGGLHEGETIEFQMFGTWLTTMTFPFWQQPGPRTDSPSKPTKYSNAPGYFIHGFLAIQQAIS